MKIVIRRFLWWVLLFILSWRKSWELRWIINLWCLFHILISVFFFQDIIYKRSQGLFWESTAYTSKLTRYWGEIWEDLKHDSWWMYIRLFLFSWYLFHFTAFILCYACFTFAAIASELRGKWQDNRRSSSAKEDINVVRWEQCKQLLQSGKQKV